MNFFPGLYSEKKHRKTTSFSNPLSGELYNNSTFEIYSSALTVASEKFLNQTKKNSAENEEQGLKNMGKTYHHRPPKLPSAVQMSQKEKKRMERQIVAINTSRRLASPKQKILFKQQTQQKYGPRSDRTHSLKAHTFSVMNNNSGFGDSVHSDLRLRGQMGKAIQVGGADELKSLSEQKLVDRTIFHDVQILVLDIVEQFEDISTKIISINLDKYFRSFFKKQLSGYFTHEFVMKVEEYFSKLLKKPEALSEPIERSHLPVEIFKLSTKVAFMKHLTELEAKPTKANLEAIEAMVKHYCVPTKQFRESCLRDIVLLLSLEIFEKFNCNRHADYILLDEQGREINEILSIKFSTKKLFMTDRKQLQHNFLKYLKIIDEFEANGKKLTFNEGMKSCFRRKIAKGQYSEEHFNYSENSELESFNKKVGLVKAEKILEQRSEIHRVNKYGYKEPPRWKELHQIRTSRMNHQQLEQIKENSARKLQALDEHFWKADSTIINPQLINTNPQSPKTSRRNSPSKVNLSTQRVQLHSLISPKKKGAIKAEVEKKFEEEFKELVAKNDLFDFNFNYKYPNRVLLTSMHQYSDHFKFKNSEQFERIVSSLKMCSAGKTNKNDQQSFIQSPSLLNLPEKDQETAQNQKEDKYSIQSISRELKERETELARLAEEAITWDEYRDLRCIIECVEPKEPLIEFVGNYLNFNQYGELSKPELTELMTVILDQKDHSTIETIVEVIWSWLQANRVIENGVLRRVILESWFQKYRIVYCLLVSLIFGTNQVTALDLAYEILV